MLSAIDTILDFLITFRILFLLVKEVNCKGDWGTRLQENPQLILQFVVMIQLTSRRILRD